MTMSYPYLRRDLVERFHESCPMRGVISEFKIRSSDWIATVDPSAA
jgi:hypothetical protein